MKNYSPRKGIREVRLGYKKSNLKLICPFFGDDLTILTKNIKKSSRTNKPFDIELSKYRTTSLFEKTKFTN